MPVSDDFTKLKAQVEEAERTVRGAATQSKAELQTKLDEARKSADDRAAELRAKTQEATGEAERSWSEVQSNWDQHVKGIRERIDAKQAGFDAKVAKTNADWAEGDAVDAIYFASAAIDEAEYAVLAAVQARMDADSLAAAT